MIDRLVEMELRRELVAAIKPVIEKAQGKGDVPSIGPSTSVHMAEAALSILLALDDAQDQMQRDGMLSSDE
jgi:hypothetical protein